MLSNLARSKNPRLAILGIGNELNGDDSAGNRFAAMLQAGLAPRPNLFLFNCGSVPENAMGPLRKFQPALVIMVDAADLDEEAGSIRWVDMTEVGGFSASSHTFPLSIIAEHFRKEFECDVQLLCIQPLSLEFDSGLSKPVNKALNKLSDQFQKFINEFFSQDRN